MKVGAPSMDIDISRLLTYRYITRIEMYKFVISHLQVSFQALENIHCDSKIYKDNLVHPSLGLKSK